jgi:hypothetical protein
MLSERAALSGLRSAVPRLAQKGFRWCVKGGADDPRARPAAALPSRTGHSRSAQETDGDLQKACAARALGGCGKVAVLGPRAAWRFVEGCDESLADWVRFASERLGGLDVDGLVTVGPFGVRGDAALLQLAVHEQRTVDGLSCPGVDRAGAPKRPLEGLAGRSLSTLVGVRRTGEIEEQLIGGLGTGRGVTGEVFGFEAAEASQTQVVDGDAASLLVLEGITGLEIGDHGVEVLGDLGRVFDEMASRNGDGPGGVGAVLESVARASLLARTGLGPGGLSGVALVRSELRWRGHDLCFLMPAILQGSRIRAGGPTCIWHAVAPGYVRRFAHGPRARVDARQRVCWDNKARAVTCHTGSMPPAFEPCLVAALPATTALRASPPSVAVATRPEHR